MYRVFCESYQNYIREYTYENSKSEYRFKVAEPLELICNLENFNQEKQKDSQRYKKLCDLLDYMEKSTDRYPKLSAFLWTLESRGLQGQCFGVSSVEDLEEQTKLVNMFLSLLYWDASKLV